MSLFKSSPRPATTSCTVSSIIYEPVDAQQIIYGTVTYDGVLVGSFYCADLALVSRINGSSPQTETTSLSTGNRYARSITASLVRRLVAIPRPSDRHLGAC